LQSIPSIQSQASLFNRVSLAKKGRLISKRVGTKNTHKQGTIEPAHLDMKMRISVLYKGVSHGEIISTLIKHAGDKVELSGFGLQSMLGMF
jgi:hypothetical protein